MPECEFVDTKQDPSKYTRLTGNRAAHRDQWEKFFGPIPEGMLVLHHCDVRGCINIEHLFLGSYQDNTSDMVAKGRHVNQKKTHCSQGHEYATAGYYQYGNKRVCKPCALQRSREQRERNHG